MKRADESLLEIFQDPLLTITALILMSTVWLIMPSGLSPVQPTCHAPDQESDQMRQELASVDQALRDLGARSQALHQDIKRLEDQIEAERQLAEDHREERRAADAVLARVERELADKRSQILKLQQELEAQDQQARKTEACFTVFSKSDKEPFWVEAVAGRLFPVDEAHYDYQSGYLELDDGTVVEAVQRTRKNDAAGDTANGVQEKRSQFQRALANLDAESRSILFLVHSDSFEVFRKAREVALAKGFEIGWWPYEMESVILVSGGAGRSIGTAGSNHRR
jgi:hypothetical protein